MGIQRGVSLYSYQEEFFLKKMNLEDCVKAVSDLGATGVEILGEQMLPTFPEVSEAFLADWQGWMEKYKVKPIAYDAFLDTKLYRNRLLTTRESVAMMKRDLQLAKRMGFKVLRSLVSTPLEVIRESIPYAEECDVKIAIEVHAPYRLDSDWLDEYIEIADKMNTKHFGIMPDCGIFVRRLPPVVEQRYIREGAHPEIVKYIGEAYFQQADADKTLEEVKKMGGNAMDQEWASMAFHYTYCDPQLLKKYIPYIYHVHAKFYDLSEDCVEPSIPYEEIVQILQDGGYEGYMDSEYEGNRHIQDIYAVDSVEQVRRQHEMFRRILGY